MKLYESENQIVYRGINHDVIKEHIESKVEKILCIYDTMENFLQEDISYNYNLLAFYEIFNNFQDEWIIERHVRFEEDSTKPWGIVGGLINIVV